jgi:hypothetical protein
VDALAHPGHWCGGAVSRLFSRRWRHSPAGELDQAEAVAEPVGEHGDAAVAHVARAALSWIAPAASARSVALSRSAFPFGRPIAWPFIAAMLLLIAGLLLFLVEIHLAMRSIRVRRRMRARVIRG